MTKNKSKKITKSTFVIIIMAIAMVAMMAFGGTFAYFTATASEKASGEMTTGYVRLTSAATFNAVGTKIIPGTKLISDKVTVTPTQSGTGAYLAIQFIVEIKLKGEEDYTQKNDAAIFNFDEVKAEGWEYDSTNNMYIYGTSADGTNTYTEVPAKDGTGTAIEFTTGALVFDVNDNTVDGAENSELKYMDANIKISIRAASIQSDNGQGGKLAATVVTEQLKAILTNGDYPNVAVDPELP